MATCSGPPDNATRAKMLESVTPLVHKLVRESGIAFQERDDARQECLIAVWKASARFDPARGVKWVTYAHAAVRGMLAELFAQRNARQRLPIRALDKTDPVDPASEADGGGDSEADDTAGPDEAAARALVAIAGPLVADLGPGGRRLFTLLAGEGLSAPQIAERLGYDVKMVELNTRALVRKLIDGGKVPADLLAKFAEWKRLDALCPARKVAKRGRGKGPRPVASGSH